MLKKIIILCSLFFWLFFSFGSISFADPSKDDCIKLNTDFPWIWKWRCIKKGDASSTFWTIMWGLMKIAINITIWVAFIALIASWVMMTLSWASQWTAWKWKDLLKKVVLWIVLLWLSWLILHAINPNFFKTG